MMLTEWGYDFIKIDWCGGEWVVPIADSWRISGDIAANFGSIMRIIDLNADLWKYAGPGHVNDMDMLQVGRGMTFEEDKTHFSMWCIMNSPLLAGNDLRTMSKETLKILTNKEIIALNQDSLVYQARRLRNDGGLELWAKPLKKVGSGQIAVALLNRSSKVADMAFTLNEIGLDPSTKIKVRDLWAHKNLEVASSDKLSFSVPKHGSCPESYRKSKGKQSFQDQIANLTAKPGEISRIFIKTAAHIFLYRNTHDGIKLLTIDSVWI